LKANKAKQENRGVNGLTGKKKQGEKKSIFGVEKACCNRAA